MVKDGHTIVIGGLFRESTTRTRSHIPGLGSLPIVGGLFGRQSDNTVREEVIILLTPHLIHDDEAYAELSKEEARNAARIRVGMRNGLMWFGRERLAEGHYRKATEAYEKGKNGAALWHLNSALGLNPKFSEAIDLKARIQGREVTSVDNSTIHGFVSRAILNDRAAASTQPAGEMTEGTIEVLPTPDASAEATEEPSTQPVAGQTSETPAETTEATAPTEELPGTSAEATPTETAPAAPEYVNTPAEQPVAGENATTEGGTAETPVEPLEGEFTPE